MPKNNVMILIPSDVLGDADTLVNALRMAHSDSGLGDSGDIRIIRPQVEAFGVTEVAQAFLCLSTGAVGWLTTKWIDDYLWPRIKEKIDKPSVALVNWISTLPKKVIKK
jgi:hypothetical protein